VALKHIVTLYIGSDDVMAGKYNIFDMQISLLFLTAKTTFSEVSQSITHSVR